MSEWEDRVKRKRDIQREILSELTPEERKIYTETLMFEWENRYLSRPRFKRPLKDLVTGLILPEPE